MKKILWTAAVILCLVWGLCGCGQQGPLYLPDDSASAGHKSRV